MQSSPPTAFRTSPTAPRRQSSTGIPLAADTLTISGSASQTSLSGISVHGGGEGGGGFASALSITVDSETRAKEENGWEYSLYHIVTTYQGVPFAADRRFKEFRCVPRANARPARLRASAR